MAVQTSAARPLTDGRSPRLRSAMSNGSKLITGADGRSREARRYRDLWADLTRDLGGNLSTADMALVRQAAALTLQAELLQAAIVRGEPVDAGELIRLSGEVRRVLRSLRRSQPEARLVSLEEHLRAADQGAA